MALQNSGMDKPHSPSQPNDAFMKSEQLNLAVLRSIGSLLQARSPRAQHRAGPGKVKPSQQQQRFSMEGSWSPAQMESKSWAGIRVHGQKGQFELA